MLPEDSTFIAALETKVKQQLGSQRVSYLLGAGSSYLDGKGYPLAFDIWDSVRGLIQDVNQRNEIQEKLDNGANGIEHALDLLDNGGAIDTPYRHVVTQALAEVFMALLPPLDQHINFVTRLAQRGEPRVKIFSLNYDPLIERAAAFSRVRLVDGYLGAEQCFFESTVFDERIGQIRGAFRNKQFDETVMPLHLLKLHGSLGWYDCPTNGVRRCGFASNPPAGTRRLMIPPQRRKASDTMLQPYAALWSAFRGALIQDAQPIHRLVCIGYGFGDEHVNTLIEAALARTDFTLLIFAKALSDDAWNRWSVKTNTVIATETRCSLNAALGVGHPDLWSFERLSMEV